MDFVYSFFYKVFCSFLLGVEQWSVRRCLGLLFGSGRWGGFFEEYFCHSIIVMLTCVDYVLMDLFVFVC